MASNSFCVSREEPERIVWRSGVSGGESGDATHRGGGYLKTYNPYYQSVLSRRQASGNDRLLLARILSIYGLISCVRGRNLSASSHYSES